MWHCVFFELNVCWFSCHLTERKGIDLLNTNTNCLMRCCFSLSVLASVAGKGKDFDPQDLGYDL